MGLRAGADRSAVARGPGGAAGRRTLLELALVFDNAENPHEVRSSSE